MYFINRFLVLSEKVESMINDEMSPKEFYILKKTVKALNNMPLFSAYGFFTISRGTLRSMFSAAITYLIIIIQFRGGRPVTPNI